MNTPISFCLVFLLYPLCHAQCYLNVPNTELFNTLNNAGLVPEPDQTKFTLQDLTYLCFVRSSSDNTKFDEVRVSFLYTYDGSMNQSAQATFTLCLSTFIYRSADVDFVTQDPHLNENMTREDCHDCRDNSTFASPTFCRCKSCCIHWLLTERDEHVSICHS